MKSSLMKRIVVLLVSVSFFSTYSLPAWSGMVTTDQLLQQSGALDKSALLGMLDREDVRQQLIERGVDPQYAKLRIAALSDAQVEELRGHIDTLPAGSGIVGIMIAVLLVLIILDIVGVTNIFSFINSPAK
ncbi:MAG TPA: hypothetical protein ENK49_07055 [Gammaproteobacteria bacterium]|nr:hypothetical protein [Gammaproteobacteria bacterium]